jgi:hypothetical protein
MYNLGDPYTSFEWFGTTLIVFIMKNGAGNRAAGIIDQKHHGNSGPNEQSPRRKRLQKLYTITNLILSPSVDNFMRTM